MKIRAVLFSLAIAAALVAINAATLPGGSSPATQQPIDQATQPRAAGVSSAQVAAKPIMGSRVFQWSDMKIQPSETAVYRGVFDDPTATLEKYSCHVTTLNPGKEPHPAHRHPEEELIIVKEGMLEVVQNNVTNLVGAGGIIFCASNEPHGWRNTTTNPAIYYVISIYPHDLKKTE